MVVKDSARPTDRGSANRADAQNGQGACNNRSAARACRLSRAGAFLYCSRKQRAGAFDSPFRQRGTPLPSPHDPCWDSIQICTSRRNPPHTS